MPLIQWMLMMTIKQKAINNSSQAINKSKNGKGPKGSGAKERCKHKPPKEKQKDQPKHKLKHKQQDKLKDKKDSESESSGESDEKKKVIDMVRKHDTNLKHTGEFSIPSLGNTKAWRKFKMKEVDSNKLSEALSLIESCKEIGDILAIHLDHKKVIHQYFTNLGDPQEIGPNIDHGNVINFDSSKSNTSLLTSARCQLLSECLARLPLAPKVIHCVSSTFLSPQMEDMILRGSI